MIRHHRHGEERLTCYHVDVLFTDTATGKRLNDADYVSATDSLSAARIALRGYRPEHNAQVVQVEKMEF